VHSVYDTYCVYIYIYIYIYVYIYIYALVDIMHNMTTMTNEETGVCVGILIV